MADLVPEIAEFIREPGAGSCRSSAAATSDRRARRVRPTRSVRRADPGSFRSEICVPRPVDARERTAMGAAHRGLSTPVRSCSRRCAGRAGPRLCLHVPPHEPPKRRKSVVAVHPMEAISPHGALRAFARNLRRSSPTVRRPICKGNPRSPFSPQSGPIDSAVTGGRLCPGASRTALERFFCTDPEGGINHLILRINSLSAEIKSLFGAHPEGETVRLK
jgi:hypothetical protein